MPEKELFEVTLNNIDGVNILDESHEQYEEKTIYVNAESEEQAADRFSQYFETLMESFGYNGMKPTTLWLYQRIQDGFTISE